MSIAITPIKAHSIGDRRLVTIDVLLDNNYPTGGYPLSVSQLGCDLELDAVFPQGKATGNVFSYDYTNKKLMSFVSGAQTTGGGDLSAVTVRVVALGKGQSVQA